MHGGEPSQVPPVGVGTSLFATTQPPTEQEEDSHSSSSNSPTRADYEEFDFYMNVNDSESSIGIPTSDAAAAQDEYQCQPPIQRLPAEILINTFSKLGTATDLLNCMLTCKAWARNAVDLLWLRPACSTWPKHSVICRTLNLPNPYFAYRDFVKRLNLATLADSVNDGSVTPLQVCTQVERLTLTNCHGLTDQGLISLITDNRRLLALDISGDSNITEASINLLAQNCRLLQGLNISGCTKISNESLINVAERCKKIKRLKFNDCHQIDDSSIMAFAKNCPNILEIDLHHCKNVGSEPVTALLQYGRSLREFRLANCDLITDSAFLSLPPNQTFQHLRILDFTSCVRLTDSAVEKIIEVAPRLRNVVFAKCRNLTDVAVNAISKLGKNLHYVHLGHCNQITDDAVKNLVHCCARIRYIDLGCCNRLTDASVTKLATLPKLRRIGLVKCQSITDESVYALSHASRRVLNPSGPVDITYPDFHGGNNHVSSLERVHLSYCINLTLRSVIILLNNCPKLTHLSLTGVQAFLRPDLEQFCRDAPPDFNQHQRDAFCVFSGTGVTGLRRYLNAEYRTRHLARMEETEGAESRSLREASTQANNGEDDLDMTGLMSAATLGGQGRVVLEGLEEAPEEDDELEDSVMTATNTPTPAGSLQPN
ncbi:SCF ubiquitin ligase complex subunit [Pseudogymnoascus australis]